MLFTTYAGIEGREKDVIAVITEGLDKGVLQPEYNTYVALAQAYYFSDQPAQAITAYQKAAPLAKDGETYLNMAKVLQQENRISEAKAAARQALAKGIKREKDHRPPGQVNRTPHNRFSLGVKGEFWYILGGSCRR